MITSAQTSQVTLCEEGKRERVSIIRCRHLWDHCYFSDTCPVSFLQNYPINELDGLGDAVRRVILVQEYESV
jgi:hypothetical protein